MNCLVLAGGYDQIALIKELKKKNIRVILADYFENPPAKDFADKHYQASTLDTDEIKKIAISENIDLITTACTDQALLTVAQVSEELGLPCYISYDIARNVTNKLYMKEKFTNAGIPTAKYRVIDKFDKELINEFKYPLVVKPVDCNSSKGVIKVFSDIKLNKAVNEALSLSRSKTAIIEEFKEGKEVSVDVYIDNGVAKVLSITESTKSRINEEGFTITQSKYPANISDFQKKEIGVIAQKISEEFNLINSPMLIQLILGEDEINVLEFSARMGGGTKYKLIEIISGVDIMSKYVELILGLKPSVEPSHKIKYAYMNYCYANNGILDRIENFDKLKKEKIIYDYFKYKTKGMKIEKALTSSDRVAGYLVIGDTIEEIYKKQELADKELKIISSEERDISIRGWISK
ncbi:ATP-grasp domain-containing protein [Clostridium sulfidigenes]|uniref:ATP-grasp domain-containing protein n=1 Tax=Clostridium sulfidigenes TaxID=318464 RepID=UPI003F899449